MKQSLHFDSAQWPEIWQATYRILEQSIVQNQLHAWIHPLECIDFQEAAEGLKVVFTAPNDFSAQWVREHYQKAIAAALSQVIGVSCDIEIIVRESGTHSLLHRREFSEEAYSEPRGERYGQQPGVGGSDHEREPQHSSPIISPEAARGVLKRGNQDRPDSRYIFENFVVGASNQFAHAIAIAVADQPAKQYNPLFLYSPPGLGKTHLLHAIGNRLMMHRPNTRVAYLSAEKFVNELIDSLQHRRMPQFRAKYRDSYDMILIDDIQFIAGKNTSEEEFFHTFNALHSSKRQIVVTSDRPPKEIEGLEERVRTRFEWGLVADISPPEIETRIAILKAKAERDDIYLPDDVGTFLATHIKSNVRELEGVLIRLQAQASLTGAEISLEMAKHELRAAVVIEGRPNLSVEEIQLAVAKYYHLRMQDLKATTRARVVALPRQIAMYLIRKYTGIGFKEIGQFFGGKDHTTILHACSKIEAGIESDPQIRNAVEAIQSLL